MKYYYEIPKLDTRKKYFAIQFGKDKLQIAILTKEKIDEIFEKIISAINAPENKENRELKQKCRSLYRIMTSIPELEYINGYGAWCIFEKRDSCWKVQEGNQLIVKDVKEYTGEEHWVIKYASVILTEVKKDEMISNNKVVKRRNLFIE